MCLDESKLGTRHTLAIMGFLGIVNVYFSRIDLSIAIVAMVGREAKQTPYSNNLTYEQGTNYSYNLNINQTELPGEFDWGPGSKGDILGSYYYGYIITQLVGAYLSTKVGFKLTWGISMLGSSLMTLLTPVLARAGGFGYLIAARIMIGLFHGVAFPCMHAAWSVWAPPLERSQLVASHISGASAGTCIIFPLGGIIAATYGWTAVFYFTGTCSLIWSICWLFMIHDSPEKHPRISIYERDYIVQEIRTYQSNNKSISKQGTDEKSPTDDEDDSIPWKSILTSPAVLSVSAAHFCSNWGNYQMNTLLPTYLDSVLKFNLASNGLLSAVPFILQSMLCFSTGWITDLICRKNLLRTVTMRRINTSLGHLVPAATIVMAGYISNNAEAAVLMFTLSIGFIGMTVAGNKSNMLDFAPKYAGTVLAVSNTISNVSGFLAPQLTGHILDANNSIEQWQIAFWISAVIYIPGLVLFLIFATDKILPWAQ